MRMTRRSMLAAAGLLLATPVLADDATAMAHQTMHEAMQEHMGVPNGQPMMPDHAMGDPATMREHMSGQTPGAGHHQAAQEAQHRAQDQMGHQHQAQQQAEHHARQGGMHQADPNRVDAANRAAMGAGAGMGAGTMGGNDACQAADQQRMTEMHPGGMMPGSGGTGGDGMGGGGSGGGGGMMPPH